MEANRLILREILKNAMEEAGEEPNLYFQPPESVKLAYPCIIYSLNDMTNWYADDFPYGTTIRYDFTYITRSPSSKLPAKLVKLKHVGFDRYYVYENLHHYAYTYTTILKEEAND